MTANYRCPTCGDDVPQTGGTVDEDIRQAHHWGEHGETAQRPDRTYTTALFIAVAALLVVLMVAVAS